MDVMVAMWHCIGSDSMYIGLAFLGNAGRCNFNIEELTL